MSVNLSHTARRIILVAIVAAFLAAPAQAAGNQQQGYGAPAGMNIWYILPPGQQAEWVFHYLGNNDLALVAFGVNPPGAINVNVYDDGQWRDLGAGDTSVRPVGKGTAGTTYPWDFNKDLINAGNLFWEAKARPSVTFHVQLTNPTKSDAQYWIAQAGVGAGGLVAISPVTPLVQMQPAAPAQTHPQAVPAPSTLPASGGAGLAWPAATAAAAVATAAAALAAGALAQSAARRARS